MAMSSEHGSDYGAGESSTDGLASSLSSLLHISQERQAATRTTLKYDIKSHIASLAHTSHLAQQRTSALSTISQEKHKSAILRSQNLRLAAGVAVRDSRLRLHHGKIEDLRNDLGVVMESGVGTDVILDVCGSRIKELLGECKRGNEDLQSMREAEDQLREKAIQLESQVEQVTKEKVYVNNELQRVKNELIVVIQSKENVSEEMRKLEENLAHQERDLEEAQGKIHDLEALQTLLENKQQELRHDHEIHIAGVQGQLAESQAQAQHSSYKHLEAERSHDHTKSLLESVQHDLRLLRETEEHLRSEMFTQQTTISGLQESEKSLLQQLTHTNKSLSEYLESSRQIKAELENEKNQTVSLMRTETDLRTRLRDFEEVVNNLSRRIEDLESNLSAAKSQGRDAENKVSSLELQLNETVLALENTRLAHHDQMSNLVESETALKEALKLAMADNAMFKDKVQQSSSETNRLNAEIESLRTNNLDLLGKVDDFSIRESEYKSERELSNKSHSELLQRNTILEDTVKSLESQISSLKMEQSKADMRIARLMGKIKKNDTLTRNYDLSLKSLRSRIDHLRKTKQTTTEHLRQAQAYEKVLISQHENLKQNLARAQLAFVETQSARSTSTSDLAKYKIATSQEIESLRNAMSELKGQQALYEDKIQSLLHTSKCDKEELTRVKDLVKDYESNHFTLDQEKQSMITQMEKLKALIKTNEQVIEEKDQQIAKMKENYQRQIHSLKAIISSGKKELDEIRATHASEISWLQSTASNNKTELTRVQTTLDERNTRIKQLERQLRRESRTIAQVSNRSSMISEDQIRAGPIDQDDDSDISAASSNSASRSNLVALAALATETQGLRRTAGQQVQLIASLEDKLHFKDKTVSELQQQLQSKDDVLSNFQTQFQELQQHVSERDRQMFALKGKAKKHDEESKYWRRVAQEKDLLILELEGFQQQLRHQLSSKGRRKSRPELMHIGSSPPPISRMGSRRLLSDTVIETPDTGSLSARLKNVRLSSTNSHHGLYDQANSNTLIIDDSSMNPEHHDSSIGQESKQTVQDSSPLSSRGGESTLSEAKTRVPSSHSMKTLLISGISNPKKGNNKESLFQDVNQKMGERRKSAPLELNETIPLKEKKPSLLYRLSHIGSVKRT